MFPVEMIATPAVAGAISRMRAEGMQTGHLKGRVES